MEKMIEEIRAGFGNVERMYPEGGVYAKLVKLLDSCDDAALVAVRDAKIKFVSKLALNRCIRRNLA